MFDDLRQMSESEEAQKPQAAAPVAAAQKAPTPKARKRSKKIFGMTGPQRFAVSALLFMMVCMTGFVLLFVTGRIGF